MMDHDGRSINRKEVILRHGGEALASAQAFARLSQPNQERVLAFLNSLVLFPPDDTASTLDPANPNTPGFPQFGHGSIKLSVLFSDPTDPEKPSNARGASACVEFDGRIYRRQTACSWETR